MTSVDPIEVELLQASPLPAAAAAASSSAAGSASALEAYKAKLKAEASCRALLEKALDKERAGLAKALLDAENERDNTSEFRKLAQTERELRKRGEKDAKRQLSVASESLAAVKKVVAELEPLRKTVKDLEAAQSRAKGASGEADTLRRAAAEHADAVAGLREKLERRARDLASVTKASAQELKALRSEVTQLGKTAKQAEKSLAAERSRVKALEGKAGASANLRLAQEKLKAKELRKKVKELAGGLKLSERARVELEEELLVGEERRGAKRKRDADGAVESLDDGAPVLPPSPSAPSAKRAKSGGSGCAIL